MSREVHVRFWEGLGVRLPRATRLLPRDLGTLVLSTAPREPATKAGS
jgi:hypothetical protein